MVVLVFVCVCAVAPRQCTSQFEIVVRVSGGIHTIRDTRATWGAGRTKRAGTDHNRAESSPISHIPKNINTSHRLFDWLSRADLTARAHQNQAQESIPYSFSYYSPTALR